MPNFGVYRDEPGSVCYVRDLDDAGRSGAAPDAVTAPPAASVTAVATEDRDR
jgi:hypothetical protein